MNKRIERIASFVPKGAIVADIGTDHAQLPILLVKDKICDKVYACDDKQGPLNSAIENIKKNHMDKSIETVLSDGFHNVPKDITCAVIAGMGFQTVIHILEDAKERLSQLETIIVQVNDDLYSFRKYLSENHYSIVKEDLIVDRKKYYTIIVLNTNYHDSYSDIELLHGPCLMKENTPLYQEYVKKQLTHYEKLMELAKNDSDTLKEYQVVYQLWQKKSPQMK